MRVRADTRGAQRKLRGLQTESKRTGGALARIGQIASGILLARGLQAGFNALRRLSGAAIDATGTMQALNLQIETLIARELKNAGNAMLEFADETGYYSHVADETYVRLDAFNEKLGDMGLSMSDVSDKFRVVNKWGADFAVITDENAASLYSATDMMELAEDRAGNMIAELRRIAIISPYTVEATNSLFKLASAYGYNSRDALKMTEAMLNVSAGIGATTEQSERMMFNFAQIRMQGKIMSRDFWELGKAGFDLNAVLKELSQTTGLVIDDHLHFNELIASGQVTWEDFANAFSSMAEKDFAGAAEKMAYTLTGLKNTLGDVFKLTIPQMLIPAAEVIGRFVQNALADFQSLIDSGVLEQIGTDIAGIVEGIGKLLGFKFAPELPEGPIGGILEGPGEIDGEEQGKKYGDGFLGGLATALAGTGGLKTAFDIGGIESALTLALMKDLITPEMAVNIQNFADAFERFSSALSGLATETLAILKEDLMTLVGAVAPEDINVMQMLTDALNGIADFINENPDLPEKLALLAEAFMFFKAAQGVASIISAIGLAILTLNANPVMILVLMLTALFMLFRGGAAKQAWITLKKIWGIILMLEGVALATFLDGVSTALEAFSGWLKKAADYFGDLNEKLGGDTQYAGIAEGFDAIGDAVGRLAGWFDTAKTSVKGFIQRIPDWLLPGSPPPLAVGFGDISGQLRNMTSGFRQAQREVNKMGQSAFGTQVGNQAMQPAMATSSGSGISPFSGATIINQTPVDKQWLVETFSRE